MIFEVNTTFGNGNSQSLKICKDLAGVVPPNGENLKLDFKSYKENNPFGNLILANSIRTFRKNHPEVQIWGRPKGQNDYLSHIGFYKACGINFGKMPGEATSSSNYVPITDINLRGYDFYDAIETKAKELSAVLQFDTDLQQLIQYIFIETIRNTFEHAETSNVFVAAQKWPRLNLVEIAIADSGCGIEGSLGRKFALKIESLLRLACCPGITAGSNFWYADSTWKNSGYGLYVLKELALAYCGCFILCSGRRAILYSTKYDGTQQEKILDTDYSGT